MFSGTMENKPRKDLCARTFVSEDRWPVSFALKLPVPNPAEEARGKPIWKPTWFSHDLYHGHRNRKQQPSYAKTREDKWLYYIADEQRAPLQDRVVPITIATEDQVALFDIGAHEGKTSAELIAPSLQKILESAEFVKAGVNILSADVKRLSNWFGLKPQGAVELSHLYNLVTAGDQLGNCTTKICSLENQVKLHLGLPLDKRNSRVRMSDWTRKVLTKEQRLYAATDVYASLML
ncbi:hypothetical protein N0V82_000301 [Gnomoniopsis sp. IMI 355080]|nr:hypothetical protein N0V82_000301 [Gnomoniopsis sp. IMI 355080]